MNSKSALTSGNDIVDNQNLLTWLNGILLHLEEILAVFFDILGCNARAGELALLANSSEANTELQCKAGAKEKATGVKADDNIWSTSFEGLGNLEFEGRDESGVGCRVGEEGHDIDKVNAGDGEVREGAQVPTQLYLPTGELGGGGGGGGGLSSRGILLRGGECVVGI